jgi:hypothetical protein
MKDDEKSATNGSEPTSGIDGNSTPVQPLMPINTNVPIIEARELIP